MTRRAAGGAAGRQLAVLQFCDQGAMGRPRGIVMTQQGD